jgi:histidine triad (HIT) family protein
MPISVEQCVFCRIGSRELNSQVVYEDDLVLAFLDIAPIRPGHTQIIPKRHHAYFEDMPIDAAARIMEIGQKLARVMKGIYAVPRVALLFTGGDIPHAHAHLVPMHEGTDITSRRYIKEDELTFRSLPRASAGELLEEARQLRLGLSTIGS